MNNLEYIENYFQNTLSPEERQVFGNRLEEDSEFAEEVAFYLSMNKVLSEKIRDDKKAMFRQEFEQNPPLQAVVRPFRRTWIYAAASILVCVSVAGYLLLRQPAAERLANDYIENNLQVLSGVLGTREDSLQQALNLFNEGKLAFAALQFEQISESDTANYLAREYAGITYLRLGNYDKALASFDMLGSYTSLRNNPASLYKALTYLKRNKPEDKNRARELLQEIVAKDLAGREIAMKWLADL